MCQSASPSSAYRMECPRCHYKYSVEGVTPREGQVEICPICGFVDQFVNFVIGSQT